MCYPNHPIHPTYSHHCEMASCQAKSFTKNNSFIWSNSWIVLPPKKALQRWKYCMASWEHCLTIQHIICNFQCDEMDPANWKSEIFFEWDIFFTIFEIWQIFLGGAIIEPKKSSKCTPKNRHRILRTRMTSIQTKSLKPTGKERL